MTAPLQFFLLLLAGTAFLGTGIAAALERQRVLQDGRGDRGFVAVGVMLAVLGALCAALVSGVAAIIALSLPLGGAGYMFAAQRLGLFRIDTGDEAAHYTEESELHT